ncbi:MAG: SIS domain-containing protein [Bdellovibrionales bacterium]|nr:SIS domain-containing protein [Bdellovibrionales bacterium]
MTIAKDFLTTSANIKLQLASDTEFLARWDAAAQTLASKVKDGGTVYLCGNGGSACDAMHFREELVARYKRERPGIKAHHFIDGSTLTCWGNDYDYESLFEREAKTFLTARDVLVAISTSGNSVNVIRAVQVAKERGTPTLGLLGKDGGKLQGLVDHALVVPSNETDRIQEVHITLIHAFCEYLES